jgi:hypothetical protein
MGGSCASALNFKRATAGEHEHDQTACALYPAAWRWSHPLTPSQPDIIMRFRKGLNLEKKHAATLSEGKLSMNRALPSSLPSPHIGRRPLRAREEYSGRACQTQRHIQSCTAPVAATASSFRCNLLCRRFSIRSKRFCRAIRTPLIA